MGTILQFSSLSRKEPQAAPPYSRRDCEVVIFPGVRIERHDLDLAHRVRDSIGGPGLGSSGRRPRRTS